jgi:hypothetical protein
MDIDVFRDRLVGVSVNSIVGDLLNNRVLIEVDSYIEDQVETKSGLSLYVDNTYTVADYIVRHGVVVKAPTKLSSWKDNDSAMTWITDIEIESGDEVWFYGMMAHSAEKLTFEGRKFLLLSYDDLYVAKRKEQVVCLNANVLLEPIQTSSKVLSVEVEHIDPLLAKVAYIGHINTEYEDENIADDPTIKKGNLVLLSGVNVRYLERKPYLFFDGKEYMVCQNNEIRGFLTD